MQKKLRFDGSDATQALLDFPPSKLCPGGGSRETMSTARNITILFALAPRKSFCNAPDYQDSRTLSNQS